MEAFTWHKYLMANTSFMAVQFGGLLRSKLECLYCAKTSLTFDPIWDLSVPLVDSKPVITLYECLDEYFQKETLDMNNQPVRQSIFELCDNFACN